MAPILPYLMSSTMPCNEALNMLQSNCMNDFLTAIYNAIAPFGAEPHGIHFVNHPILFWFLVIANAITALSYVLIPLAILYFIRRRKDLVFQWVFVFFGAFIILCGFHHLIHVITYWYPVYYLQSVVDTSMAIVSFLTFVFLVPLIPKALALPSQKQLEEANKNLTTEVEARKQVEAKLKENEEILASKNEILIKTLEESDKQKDELLKLNRFMVDRESKMVEMKKEIEEMKKKNP